MEDVTRSPLDPSPTAPPEERGGYLVTGAREPDPPTDSPAFSDPPASPASLPEVKAWSPQLALKAMLACAAAFTIPGAGHAILGRWIRAMLLCAAILGMFAAGLFLFEGKLYTFNPEEPLSIFPVIANAGLGGIYALCAFLRAGFDARPEVPTYEYGNAFLLVAGLLNYLAALDAFDIAIGRKK